MQNMEADDDLLPAAASTELPHKSSVSRLANGLSRDLQRLEDAVACRVCCCVMTEPVTTTTCGHTVCCQCFHSYLSLHKSCPVCQNSVQGTQVVRNGALAAVVDVLVRGVLPKLAKVAGDGGAEARRDKKDNFSRRLDAMLEGDDKARCDRCRMQVPKANLDRHQDLCGKKVEPSQSKTTMKFMPKTAYTVLTDRALKQELKKLGLSTKGGDKAVLIRRHQKFTALWNAERMKVNPRKTAEDIASEVHRTEELERKELEGSRSVRDMLRWQRTGPQDEIDRKRKHYIQANKSQFQKLVEQARQNGQAKTRRQDDEPIASTSGQKSRIISPEQASPALENGADSEASTIDDAREKETQFNLLRERTNSSVDSEASTVDENKENSVCLDRESDADEVVFLGASPPSTKRPTTAKTPSKATSSTQPPTLAKTPSKSSTQPSIQQSFQTASAKKPATGVVFSSCPVCQRRVRGDINAHLDYCLRQSGAKRTVAKSKTRKGSKLSFKRRKIQPCSSEEDDYDDYDSSVMAGLESMLQAEDAKEKEEEETRRKTTKKSCKRAKLTQTANGGDNVGSDDEFEVRPSELVSAVYDVDSGEDDRNEKSSSGMIGPSDISDEDDDTDGIVSVEKVVKKDVGKDCAAKSPPREAKGKALLNGKTARKSSRLARR